MIVFTPRSGCASPSRTRRRGSGCRRTRSGRLSPRPARCGCGGAAPASSPRSGYSIHVIVHDTYYIMLYYTTLHYTIYTILQTSSVRQLVPPDQGPQGLAERFNPGRCIELSQATMMGYNRLYYTIILLIRLLISFILNDIYIYIHTSIYIYIYIHIHIYIYIYIISPPNNNPPHPPHPYK